MKKIVSIIICFVIICVSSGAISVLADDTIKIIASTEKFLEFAKECRNDTYSKGKVFRLFADIDLSSEQFDPIPYFAGEFDGNNHTVTGLTVTKEGSRQGLFRVLDETATVENLTVKGSVKPNGSKCNIGGVVGENSGKIINCTFSGTVSGASDVGGIAGINNATGIVENCIFNGDVTGEYKVGGIVGENSNQVINCENRGKINTVEVKTSSESELDVLKLADLATSNNTLNLAKNETATNNITDIGGITGYTSGTVQNCKNTGDVGYQHIGYNVGGIAGRSIGYITDCTNYGNIVGRKDAGGIVGQMEPNTSLEISEINLDNLQSKIQNLKKTISSTKNSISSEFSAISDQLGEIENKINDTLSQIDPITNTIDSNINILSDSFKQELAILKEMLSADNHASAIELMNEIDKIINGEVERNIIEEIIYLNKLIKNVIQEEGENIDKNLLAKLVEVAEKTKLNEINLTPFIDACENVDKATEQLKELAGEVGQTASKGATDISAQVEDIFYELANIAETATETTSKIQYDTSLSEAYNKNTGATANCKNYSSVTADINIGGIAGAMSYEVLFDLEDDYELPEVFPESAKILLFSTIRSCESYGDANAKKGYAGGIVGKMLFGSCVDSIGAGTIDTIDSDYCGGVAGQSKGTVASCFSRAVLKGSKYIGGISGYSKDISDSRAYTFLEEYSEYAGSVTGWTEGTLSNNVFVSNGLGGVDDISKKGIAEEISYEEMIAMDGTPDVFKNITVTFVAEGKVFATEQVPFGGSIEKLPEYPMNEAGQYWKWDDFNNEKIYYSLTVGGKYYNPKTSIASGEDVPEFIVEGQFYENQYLVVTDYDTSKLLAENSDREILKANTLYVNDYEGNLIVRMRTSDDAKLTTLADNGEFVDCGYKRDGSYIVFDLKNDGSFIYEKVDQINILLIVAIAGTVVIAGGIVAIIIVKKKKSKNQTHE